MFSPSYLIGLVGIGVGAGLVSGLFGIGGGLLAVPALVFFGGLPVRDCIAASLLGITLATPIGILPHVRAGNVRVRSGLTLGVGGIGGVALGAYVDPYVPEIVLLLGLAGMMAWAAQRLVYGAKPLFAMEGPGALLATGFVAGFIAKLLGIGGGILMVPALVIGGETMHAAVATSLLAVLTNSTLSTMANLVQATSKEWVVTGLVMGLGMTVGAWTGSHLGLRSPAEGLKRAFAVGMLLIAVSLVYRAFQG